MNRTPLLIASTIVIVVGASTTQAEEWRWRRIGWEGTRVRSVVSLPDSGNVIYVSVDQGLDRGVHKSTDGGQTWRFLPESQSFFSDLLTVNPRRQEEIYCGSWSSSCSPGTWPKRSRDAGEHWEEIEAPMNRLIPSPWIPGMVFGIQAYYYYYWLYRSVDDGVTWEGLTGSPMSHMSDNMVFHREDSLFVFAGLHRDGGAWLGRSEDAGFTWEGVLEGEIPAFDQDPLNGSHWGAVSIREEDLTDRAWFAESGDNGTTWETRVLPDSIWYVKQMVFDLYEPGTIYLVDPWAPGYPGTRRLGVYRSMDGGGTWGPMNEGFGDTTVISWMVPVKGRPGELMAAGYDGLWLWTDGVGAEVVDLIEGESLRLEMAPNPFVDMLRAWAVGMNGSDVTAGMYTLEGRLVRRLWGNGDPGGQMFLVWNGRDELGRVSPPGVYILTIRSGKAQESKRVVKLRR